MRPSILLALASLCAATHAQDAQTALLHAAAQLNGLAPQAVPTQTVLLGTWNVSTHEMAWSIPLVYPEGTPDSKKSENGGPVHPRPQAGINSYSVTYEVALAGPIGDLSLSLSENGEDDKPIEIAGSVDAAAKRARVAFHPHSGGMQTLHFTSGGNASSAMLFPHLAEQLGSFVVPYLLVTIVYEPPGGGSSAKYETTSTSGTTVSWGFSRTSGLVDTENADALGDLMLNVAAQGVGAFNGAMGAAVTIIGQLKGSTSVQTTDQMTQAVSGSAGTSFSVSAGFDTTKHLYPGGGDGFVYLRDVLFVYVVQNNRVHLAPIAYAGPVRAKIYSELQADLPAQIVAQFRALDPLLTGELPRPGAGNTPLLAGLGRGRASSARFRFFANWACDSSIGQDLTVTQAEISSSGTAETLSHTELTQTSGIISSIEGGGDPLWGLTYSSSRDQYQQDELAASVHFLCGPDEQPFNAEVWIDTLFHTLLCVKGQPLDAEVHLMGTVSDENGQPHARTRVALHLGETTWMTNTDAQGVFRFRGHGLPNGAGALVAGKQAWAVNYAGAPLKDLRLGLSRAGEKIEPIASTPAKHAPLQFPPLKKKER